MRALGWVLVVASVVSGTAIGQELVPSPPSPSVSPSLPAAPQAVRPQAQPLPAPAALPLVTPSAPTPGAPARPSAATVPASTPAAPKAAAASGPAIVVVMESSGGVRAAGELRAALNQVGYRVLAPADAQRKGIQPAALLTVAFSAPAAANGARSVDVAYWGRAGRADRLTATSLATLDQLNAVALALSSALIDRHLTDEASFDDSILTRARLSAGPTPGVLYAMVTSAPRTNVRLRFEDF